MLGDQYRFTSRPPIIAKHCLLDRYRDPNGLINDIIHVVKLSSSYKIHSLINPDIVEFIKTRITNNINVIYRQPTEPWRIHISRKLNSIMTVVFVYCVSAQRDQRKQFWIYPHPFQPQPQKKNSTTQIRRAYGTYRWKSIERK